MPQDAIERWEWEGGTVAAPAEREPDDTPEVPAEAAGQVEGVREQASSTISSRRPPDASASAQP
jgi:hypothetical protein